MFFKAIVCYTFTSKEFGKLNLQTNANYKGTLKWVYFVMTLELRTLKTSYITPTNDHAAWWPMWIFVL